MDGCPGEGPRAGGPTAAAAEPAGRISDRHERAGGVPTPAATAAAIAKDKDVTVDHSIHAMKRQNNEVYVLVSKIITAKTLPCHVELLRAEPCSSGRSRRNGESNKQKWITTLEIVLTAGRNRQIRRMVEEGLGKASGSESVLKVTRIHRSSFSGVTLEGLQCEGSFAELTAQEMQRIQLSAQGYGAESSTSTTASNTGRLRNKD